MTVEQIAMLLNGEAVEYGRGYIFIDYAKNYSNDSNIGTTQGFMVWEYKDGKEFPCSFHMALEGAMKEIV